MKKFCRGHSNMPRSEVENILKKYWSVLINRDLEETSNICGFSSMFSLKLLENGKYNSSPENHLKSSKNSRLEKELLIFVKNI